MEKAIVKVDGMMCEHCVKAVTGAVSALPGIGTVAVDLQAGTVSLEHDPAQSSLDKIKSEIEEQGYNVID
ncbi:MAG: cation transporter [Oscillospiraceae bacterium]|jgi:copper chaperone|nr:cation transporter [Oscillospiraceae bacterium]